MKHVFFCLFSLFIIFSSTAFSQSKKSAQQMMKEAMKEVQDDGEIDPEVKKNLLRMFKSDAVKQVMNMNEKQYSEMMSRVEPLTSLPAFNQERINAVPAEAYTKEKMISAVKAMKDKLYAQLSTEQRSDVNKIAAQSKDNSGYLTTASLIQWYHGNTGQALYLAANAASVHENANALNNVGAMLNLYGYEEKAIPLLEYAKKIDPDNASVLNNLGRAWLGLGDKKKAKMFYLNCVNIAPLHPEANNGLGCLYEAAGDKIKATEYFKKSIEGGFNELAGDHIQQLDPGYNFFELVRRHHKAPEYFNQFKYKVPEELYFMQDYYKVKELHRVFREELTQLGIKYSVLIEDAEKKAEAAQKSYMENLQRSIKNGIPMKVKVYPFALLSSKMLVQLSYYFDDAREKCDKEYYTMFKELQDKKTEEFKAIDEKINSMKKFGTYGEFTGCLNCDELYKQRCREIEAAEIKYQRQMADAHKLYVEKKQLLLTGFFDEALYWYNLSPVSNEFKDVEFYRLVINYLSEVKKLSENTPFFLGPSNCEGQQASPFHLNPKEQVADKKRDCPIDVTLPFIVGKITLDCSSFSISGGEGFTAGYKKDFTSGQSTLSIGAGLTVEAGKFASAGAGESIYVTFNKENVISDIGLKFVAGGDLKAMNISTSANAGYTMSMNAGWDFTASGAGRTIHL